MAETSNGAGRLQAGDGLPIEPGFVLAAFSRALLWREGRHGLLLFAGVALLFTLPALWVGFAADDHFFLSVFKGSPGLERLEQPIWNTFTFSDGDLSGNQIRIERGILPWWAAGEWKVDLWRPVASLSHWADYQLFGEVAWPMHVHSLLLYALLAVVTAILYRRLNGGVLVASLAGLLFAMDASHGIPAGWLSNRNALLAALFGVLALLAHHKWRETAEAARPWGRWYPFGFLSLLALAVALFCCEAAVSTGAYFFAYALFLDPVSRATRTPGRLRGAVNAFAVLLPYLAVVVAWRMIYTGLGHGVGASWLYIDPLGDTVVFARDALQHYPVLMLGLFGLPDGLFWVALPPAWQALYLAAGVSFLLFAAWCVWPLLKANPTARFWALGAALSVIPACGTMPQDRLLTFASIGAMGLIGLYLGEFAGGGHWIIRGVTGFRRRRALASAWTGIHLVISPVLLLGASGVISTLDRALIQANESVEAAEALGAERIVVVNTPLDLLGASLPLLRSARSQSLPERWWWLSAGNRPVEVERVDDHSVVLRPEGGFLQRPWSQIFRRPGTHPMTAGDRVQLAGMEAEVLSAAAGGQPLEVRFTFEDPLTNDALTWMTWSGIKYVPFTLPAAGETVRTPGFGAMDVLRIALGMNEKEDLRRVARIE